MNVELEENERIDDLEYKGLKIIQNNHGFCFGMDSVLLSDFAKEIKKNSTVVDLGTGTGILGILLCGKTELKKIIGIEIQEDVYKMAKKSIELNQLQNRFEIINADIKNVDKYIKSGTIDVVVTNPPYKKLNTGLINENETKLISRHEIKCSLEVVLKQSAVLLKNKGTLYMVHRPERLAEIIVLLNKYKMEPKVIKFVYHKISKKPNLILIKAIKNAKSFLQIDEPFIVYKENGEYTEQLLKAYNKGE